MSQAMLTTVDNPYNPHTNFNAWYAWDTAHGYHTCEYFARICKVSDALSDTEYEEAVDEAIDEILDFDLAGIYTKAYPNDKK